MISFDERSRVILRPFRVFGEVLAEWDLIELAIFVKCNCMLRRRPRRENAQCKLIRRDVLIDAHIERERLGNLAA